MQPCREGLHGRYEVDQCDCVSNLSNKKWISKFSGDANDDVIIVVVYAWEWFILSMSENDSYSWLKKKGGLMCFKEGVIVRFLKCVYWM